MLPLGLLELTNANMSSSIQAINANKPQKVYITINLANDSIVPHEKSAFIIRTKNNIINI